ncbi:ClpXP protease specificity-enhancing factor [Hydrogenophaga sp.]|uniref:ClpXP protease specificity-enhancing factor n=1 Tax=Hydrogenophaga sp. TaxID=1904254 RepID=UPI002717CAB1|nr:ClpXP protease specificity-enhancing factor [Hydrogenophaga sp.]MDO9436130.1 ClpXP protease specificity-enhancing factor [Hydrogenophaga sp.]
MSTFAPDAPSTRPYLIRALHEWCVDNGFSPYIAVQVDASVRVPMEFVKNGEIVLNVSMDATSALRLGNDFIDFKARFGGVAREIVVPVTHVIAIYARENGQGMAFPAPVAQDVDAVSGDDARGENAPGERAPEVPNRGGSPLRAVVTETPSAEAGEPPPELPPTPGRPGGKPQLKRVK